MSRQRGNRSIQVKEDRRGPPPRAATLPSADDKTHHLGGAPRGCVAVAVAVRLAPVVLVGVVVAVPHPAARAEPQSAVVAVGHTAEGVGLGGQGRHVGSPGGAARVGGHSLLEGEHVLRLGTGSLVVQTLPQVRVRADSRAGGQGLAEGVSLEQGIVF